MGVLARLCCVLPLVLGASLTAAQSYPSKTLRIVVAFPAGGSIDIVARMLVPKLSENMERQVIVDNRARVDGAIGTENVIKSE